MTERASTRPVSTAKRRKFLVVADGTPESEVAIHFASLRATHTDGIVTLLAVIDPGEVGSQWLGVQSIMREEARGEAEALLHRLATHVHDYAGIIPELVIREGRLSEELHKLVEEDKDIAIVVLASSTAKDDPGPLVTMVSKNGFPIPVTIVPGALTEEAVQALA